MEPSETPRKNAQKLADAINKVILEIDPTQVINPTPVKGIIIMQFPTNHTEHKDVWITVQGQICVPCAFKYLQLIYAEAVMERMGIAD
jgi:hypothetical protein